MQEIGGTPKRKCLGFVRSDAWGSAEEQSDCRVQPKGNACKERWGQQHQPSIEIRVRPVPPWREHNRDHLAANTLPTNLLYCVAASVVEGWLDPKTRWLRSCAGDRAKGPGRARRSERGRSSERLARSTSEDRAQSSEMKERRRWLRFDRCATV